MNRKRLFCCGFLFLFSCFFVGCREGGKEIFLGSSVPHVVEFKNSLLLEGTLVDVDNFGAADVFIADTFIVFTTPRFDTLYSVSSLNTYGHLGNFVTKGNGPLELLGSFEPLSVFSTANSTSISIYDFYTNRYYKWDLTNSIKYSAPVFTDTVRFSDMPGLYKIHPLDNELLFLDYIDPSELNQHYAVYHIPTEKIMDDKVALLSGITELANSYLLATCTSFSLVNRKYVSAMGFIDQLNIYDLDRPEGAKALTVHKKRMGMEEVERTPMPEKMEYYVDVRSDASRIYALYANQNRKDWAVNETPAVIQVFDWDGNPICELKTKEKIVHFDVDENGGKLYGLTTEEELYVYDLGKME